MQNFKNGCAHRCKIPFSLVMRNCVDASINYQHLPYYSSHSNFIYLISFIEMNEKKNVLPIPTHTSLFYFSLQNIVHQAKLREIKNKCLKKTFSTKDSIVKKPKRRVCESCLRVNYNEVTMHLIDCMSINKFSNMLP